MYITELLLHLKMQLRARSKVCLKCCWRVNILLQNILCRHDECNLDHGEYFSLWNISINELFFYFFRPSYSHILIYSWAVTSAVHGPILAMYFRFGLFNFLYYLPPTFGSLCMSVTLSWFSQFLIQWISLSDNHRVNEKKLKRKKTPFRQKRNKIQRSKVL